MRAQKKRIKHNIQKSGIATRRKRMLANNKKKIIWRNRAFMQLLDA
ncbi:hypothetical protein [Vibrio sp. 10N.286.49.B3]|nr:hypothetical protein [Vibrio sp. 10N.286.49.B3]